MSDTPAHEYDRPSKSQVKREMHALLDLGKTLVELPTQRLRQLALPEKLHEAIVLAQRITSREGRRRQEHYVGKLLRQIDTGPIAEQLAQWADGGRAMTDALHRLEALRDLLLRDDSALTALLTEYPDTDIQPLRTLIREARREAKHNAEMPEGQTPLRKHHRALFQFLKTLPLDTENS